jgi:hypothetical protein
MIEASNPNRGSTMLVQQIAPVAGHEFAPIFVALELSRSKWLVGVGTPEKWAVRRPEVDGGDLDGLLALLKARGGWRRAARRRSGPDPCLF